MEPDVLGDVDLDEMSFVTGGTLGRSPSPGQGWSRVLWQDLDTWLGADPPSHNSFSYKSWPVNMIPPPEGALDREQFARLVDHLVDVSPDGGRTPCWWLSSRLSTSDWDADTLYVAALDELVTMYDDAETVDGSPTNVWPNDRSWFVYTDTDLWGTKVSGSRLLIERLSADPVLETITLEAGRARGIK